MSTNRQARHAAELKQLREENDRLRMWILVMTGAQTDDGPALVVPNDGLVQMPREALLESYAITATHHQMLGATLMRDAAAAVVRAKPPGGYLAAVAALDPFTVCASARPKGPA